MAIGEHRPYQDFLDCVLVYSNWSLHCGTMELQLETDLGHKPNLEDNDVTALSKEQQDKLNSHKVKSRIENEHYLRQHPELTVLVSNFVREVLLTRPKSIRRFAADYFDDPSLPEKLKV